MGMGHVQGGGLWEEAQTRRWERLEFRRRVMLVEDDARLRELMAMLLQSEGFDTIELGDGLEALSFLAALEVYRGEVLAPELIIADISMPTYSGLDMLMGMKELRERPPVMLVTGVRDEDILYEGSRLGAACVLTKPFDVDHFLDTVHLCLKEPSIELSEATAEI